MSAVGSTANLAKSLSEKHDEARSSCLNCAGVCQCPGKRTRDDVLVLW